MIRITIELLPGGRLLGKRVIGMIEIANTKVLPGNYGEYVVVLKKTPPFTGALRTAWRRGRLREDEEIIIDGLPGEDEEILVARVAGYHRTRRGIYDLLYMTLRACGMEARNP